MGLLICLAVSQCILPDQDMSRMENRMLAQKPFFSMAGYWDGSYSEALEAFASDQLPLRDGFVSLYTAAQWMLGRRTIGDAILGKGMLFDRSEKWSVRNAGLNASALEELAQRTGTQAFLLAVPSSAAVYPHKLPASAPVADEEALLAAAAGQTHLIPLLASLREAADGALLYYATDHHWTAAGAYIGYMNTCTALGIEPEAQRPSTAVQGFFGSFYARFPLPWLSADSLSYPPCDGIRLLINGEEKTGLLDPEAFAGRDKYAALLYGNHASLELINDAAPDRTLLVIKDSYANALLPLLSTHYRRIVAVDPRYFSENIVEFVNEYYEGETILCVYGLNTLSSGRTIALLEGL